jgi:hypothetical protein
LGVFLSLFLHSATSSAKKAKPQKGRPSKSDQDEEARKERIKVLNDFMRPHLLTGGVVDLPASLLSLPDSDIMSRDIIDEQVASLKASLGSAGWSPQHSLVCVIFGYEIFEALEQNPNLPPRALTLRRQNLVQAITQRKVKVHTISGAHRVSAMQQLMTEDPASFTFDSINVSLYVFDKKTEAVKEILLAYGNLMNEQHSGATNSFESRVLYVRKELKRMCAKSQKPWSAFKSSLVQGELQEKFSKVFIKSPAYLQSTIRFALLEDAPFDALQGVLKRNLEVRLIREREKSKKKAKRTKIPLLFSENNLSLVLSLPPTEQKTVLSDILNNRITPKEVKGTCHLVRASGLLCAGCASYLSLDSWAECAQRFPTIFNSQLISVWMNSSLALIENLENKWYDANKPENFRLWCPPGLLRFLEHIKTTKMGDVAGGDNVDGPVRSASASSVGADDVRVLDSAALSLQMSMEQLSAETESFKNVSDFVLCFVMCV